MKRRLVRGALVAIAVIAMSGVVMGQTRPERAGPERGGRERRGRERAGQGRMRELARLERELQEAFAKDDWAGAASRCERILKIVPEHATTQYNLACSLSRLKKPDEAMGWLTKAVENGFSDAEHMKVDPDLEPLTKKAGFEKLVELAAENEKAGGGKYEKGAEIAGVKTVEGLPEGGYRYRLRMPVDADEKKPAKLIVWLHPTGESGNEAVEKLSPELAKRGYALVVLSQKNFSFWDEDELPRLMEKTLPEVGKVKGIDGERPILLGYEAGGQVALDLWMDEPEKWGGVILEGAYPVEVRNQRLAVRELPRDVRKLKGTPLLAVVGKGDRGAEVWKQAGDGWLHAGVALKVEVVAGKGAEWLLEGETLEKVLGWLEEVKGGKLPADKAVKAKGEVEI